jgi:hypothetical protein
MIAGIPSFHDYVRDVNDWKKNIPLRAPTVTQAERSDWCELTATRPG